LSEQFDERSFWMSVKRYAGKVSFIPDAVALYFCMVDQVTPIAIKATIAVALTYFVLPMDSIPDWIPGSGLADDGAVVAFTLAVVQSYVTEAHRRSAREWLAP
jgi:uncharacterized membrane protein YkvA (DUF1232 family)